MMRFIFWIFMCGLLGRCGLFQPEQETVVIGPQEIGVIVNIQTGEIDDFLFAGTYPLDPQKQEVILHTIAQQEYTMASLGPETDSQPHGDAIGAVSLDGEAIWVNVTLLFAINPLNIETIHHNWGHNYAEDFLRPTVRSLVRETAREFTAEQIYGEARGTLEAQMQERITERINEEGFIMIDFLVRGIYFTEEFTQSVEATLIYEQEATRAAQRTATPAP